MPTLSLRQISKIPVAERILLAERLWESIPEHSDQLALSASQLHELDRRPDALESNSAKTTSWPQVKAKMRARRVWK